jgi:hypothetical protein
LGTELGRRLTALESKAGIGHDSVEVIIRTFVLPGPNGPVKSEPNAIISLSHGWRIERKPGESAEAFVNRAADAAPLTFGGVTSLMEGLA